MREPRTGGHIPYFTFLGPRPGVVGFDARPRALPDVMQTKRSVGKPADLGIAGRVAARDRAWAVDLDDGSSSRCQCAFPHLQAV